MNDFDLDRLGEVWRTQPDEAEMAALQRSAEQVRRRARWLQFSEAVLAILVSGVVLVLALSNPRLESLLAGGAAIVLMLGSSVRQRQLRRLELKSLTGTTEEMLDQAIARVEATLKRARLHLFFVPPGLALGIAFGAALNTGGGSDLLARFSENPWLGGRGIVAVAFVAAVVLLSAHLLQLLRRSRRELERLRSLREDYRRENEDNSTNE